MTPGQTGPSEPSLSESDTAGSLPLSSLLPGVLGFKFQVLRGSKAQARSRALPELPAPAKIPAGGWSLAAASVSSSQESLASSESAAPPISPSVYSPKHCIMTYVSSYVFLSLVQTDSDSDGWSRESPHLSECHERALSSLA